jgi:hypothetical protein
LLQIAQAQAAQFELPAGLTTVGSPKCDRGYATQSFAGPADNPGPFNALFTARQDGSAWELFAVNCIASVEAGQRQVC